MAHLVYTILTLLLFSQVVILHEPFPKDVRHSLKIKGKGGKGDTKGNKGKGKGAKGTKGSNPDGTDPDELKSIDDARFQLQKLMKKMIRRTDDTLGESSSMALDPKTDTWTPPQNHVKSKYEPSIFPHERIWVHDRIRVDAGRLISSSSRQSIKRIPVTSIADPRTHNFYWGEFKITRKSGYSILPSVSPHMKIVDVVMRDDRLKFWSDGNGVYYLGPITRKDFNEVVRVRVAAPHSYFDLTTFPEMKMPQEGTFPGAKELRQFVRARLGVITSARGLLTRLVTYFRAFEVKALSPYSRRELLYQVIFKQKRGVCRHRALLFLAMAQAFGFEVRMVFNTVHAFTEIRLPGEEEFRRLDLGGAVIPDDMRPPATAPGPNGNGGKNGSTATYTYSIKGPETMLGAREYMLTLHHASTPPAMVWLSLIDPSGKRWLEQAVLPPLGKREQTLKVIIPKKIAPGMYRFVVTPKPLR